MVAGAAVVWPPATNLAFASEVFSDTFHLFSYGVSPHGIPILGALTPL